MYGRAGRSGDALASERSGGERGTPGKRTRTEGLPIQRKATEGAATGGAADGPPTDDPPEIRKLAFAEAPKIQKEHEDAVFAMKTLIGGREELQKEIDALEASGKDPDKLQRLEDGAARMAELETKLAATISSTEKDLALLEKPGASDAELNDMIARRMAASNVIPPREETEILDEATRRDAGEGRFTRFFSRSRVETKETVSTGATGASVVSTDTNGRSLDHTGASWSEEKETRVTHGDDSASAATSRSTKVGRDGYTSTTKKEEAATTSGVSTGSSETKTTKVDAGGVTVTNEKSEKVDDHEIKSTSTTAVTRGDGKLGVSRTGEKQDGLVDEDGNLAKGTKTTTTKEAHVVADKDKVGAGASTSATRETAHSENVKTGVSAHCDGNVTVSVVAYDGDEETFKGRFVVVLSINLSAGGSLSADATGKNDSGTSGSFGAKAKGKLTAGGQFKHILTAEETQAYLNDLGGVSPGNAGNGRYPEFAQIATAWKNGWSGDGAVAAEKAAAIVVDDSPEAAKAMAEGDEVSYTVGAEGELGGNAGGKSGLGSAGLNGKIIKRGSLSFTYGKLNGQIVVTVMVDTASGWGAGASGGVGVASMSYGHEETKGQGAGATFYLDPNKAYYSGAKADIDGARTIQDVERLKKTWAQLLESQTVSESESEKDTYGVDVAGVGVEMGSTGTVSKKVTTNDKGETVEEHKGSSDGGAALKVGDFAVSDRHEESITTVVNEKNEATGDLAAVDRESDVTKSLLSWDDRRKQSPGVGDATGSNAFKVEETVETSGLLLSNQDYEVIMGAAKDPKRWIKATDDDIDEWMELRKEIAACGNDKKKVAEKLARFMGDGDNTERKDALTQLVRPGLSNQGGAAYELPDGLGDLKSQYAKLVFDDPGVKARELDAKGDKAGAAAEAQAKIEQLDSLYNALSSNAEDKFKDKRTFAEMLSRIAARKQELARYLNLTEQQQATRRYNDLLTSCQKWKRKEEQAYEEINDLRDAVRIVELQNQLKGMYLEWDPAYKEMGELVLVWGFDREVYRRYAPDKVRFKQTMAGEKPVGLSLEEESEQNMRERQMREQNEYIGGRLLESTNARLAAMEPVEDRATVVARVKGNTQKYKTRALTAAGWHNYAMKTGKPIKPEAQKAAGEAWTQFALVEKQHKDWEKKVDGDATLTNTGIINSGGAVQVGYMNVESMFEDAQKLNQ